jgi:hypothetical protein
LKENKKRGRSSKDEWKDRQVPPPPSRTDILEEKFDTMDVAAEADGEDTNVRMETSQ